MPKLADDTDVTLLAMISHLQHRIFLLEGKSAADAERLTRRVVALMYRMAFGEGPSAQKHESIDRAAEHLLAAIRTLEEVIADEEQALRSTQRRDS